MGQTTEIFPKAKKIYKSFFHSQKINKFIAGIIVFFVDWYATLKHFHFPAKFSWDWKLEMLMHRYEEETVDLFRKIIKPGMTVIDIGAHIGYFSVLFSDLVGVGGTVISFEPDVSNFELLKKNTSELKNVKINNIAISDKLGVIDFYKTVEKTGSHSIIPSEFRPEKVSAKTQTLDSFVGENGNQAIDVIKIDIEGAEPLALTGMKDVIKNNPNLKIIMEFSPSNLALGGFDVNALLNDLSALSLDYHSITAEGLKPLDTAELSRISQEVNGYTNLYIIHRNN